MKTIRILPYFMLICAIFLLSSCSAYQLAQWSHGGSATAPSGSDGYYQANYCPHHPNSQNYMGGSSNTSLFPIGQERPVYCPKCGKYGWVRN